ncbi:MAG: hypothetical protein AAFR38_06525 [Planctomycetota bacterium]
MARKMRKNGLRLPALALAAGLAVAGIAAAPYFDAESEQSPGVFSVVDLAEPFGVIDEADTEVFVDSYVAGGPTAASMAWPYDEVDEADSQAFERLWRMKRAD